MEKELVIVGAGGFGREILWQLREQEYKILGKNYHFKGFIDDNKQLKKEICNQVIGSTDELLEEKNPISVLIAIGNAKTRRNIAKKLMKNTHLSFPNFIAESAKVSDDICIGQGCIICMSSIITVNVKLGDFVVCNLDCTIGHDSTLEDFVTLYPSVNVSGNVSVGTTSEIGTGTQIIQGNVIGKECILGAGAVVNKQIADYATAVGIPAKIIKYCS